MLTVGDMFAGVGGITSGFQQAGFKIEWASEFDKYACNTYRTNFPTHHLIEADVKTVQAEDVKYVDVITSGFPCFREDALVLTLEYGYIKISEMVPDLHVLTHTGNWKKVIRVMMKSNGEVKRFNSSLCPDLFATDEHPFYIKTRFREWNNDDRTYKRKFTDEKWKDLNDLTKDDFVCSVLPNKNKSSEKSPAFWLLVGRYLSNGWRVKRKNRKKGGKVVICCDHLEKENIEKIIKDAEFTATMVKERTTYKFHINSNELYDFLKSFGHKAHNKTLPGYIFNLDLCSTKALVDGYLSGDNGIYKGTKYFITVSTKLALGMALLLQKCYNIVPNIQKVKVPKTTLIDRRLVSQRLFYKVNLPIKNSTNFVDDIYGRNKIKSISTIYTKCAVWNIEVEDDNSYLVNNTVVHNCQAFSIAGHRKGFKDPRGNMFFETARFIDELRPRAYLIENVKNLKGHDKGKTLKIIRNTLVEKLGYSFIPFVLSAHQHGNIPQNRERIYIVGFKDEAFAIKKDTCTNRFLIPHSIDLTLSYRNMLVYNKQDDKYYFSEDHKYMPALKETMTSKNYIYQWRRKYVRTNKKGFCPTLTANMGAGGHNVPLIIDDYGKRRLIPRECFRFQGFSESFILPEKMSDTQLYKQAGNSVTVPVIKRIAKNIKKVLDN